jgi:UDP-MurNAc hydroxylase
VNLNDCPFDYLQIEMIKEFCGGSPDLACLPYAGAGPYPQMYQFKSSEEYLVAAEKKKQQFLAQFGRYLSELKPHYAMPFAGLYYLGGALRSRNRFRGIPDALEVQEIFGDSVVVLEEEFGEIDLVKGEWSHPRTKRYEDEDRDKYLSKFDLVPYHYESDAQVELEELKKLLQMAHNNAVSRIQSVPSRWICFQVKMSEYLCVHSEYPGVVESRNAVDDLAEREVISIDGRLLHGLLTRKFHWNNAEIGSHFSFFRSPETYDRRVYDLLNFLHV